MRAVNQPEEEKSTVSTTTVVNTKDREKTHHTLHVHVMNGLDTEDNRYTCTLVRLDTKLIRGLDMI